MDPDNYKLLKFKIDKMVPNASMVMIAKRGSGKSVVCRDILYHNRDIPCGVIICPTESLNGDYKKIFPDTYIHYDVTEEVLKKIMVRQMIMAQKTNKKRLEGKKIDPRCLLLMDDCLAEKKKWDKIIYIPIILLNGRHYNLTYMLTMQDPIGMKPAIRNNFDYVFLLQPDGDLTKKKIWENYASMFKNLDEFKIVIDKCTEDWRIMVIDRRTTKGNLVDKVFWYKANPDNKFLFGSPKFIKLHEKYYDSNYNLNEQLKNLKDLVGPGNSHNKKKRIKLNLVDE